MKFPMLAQIKLKSIYILMENMTVYFRKYLTIVNAC